MRCVVSAAESGACVGVVSTAQGGGVRFVDAYVVRRTVYAGLRDKAALFPAPVSSPATLTLPLTFEPQL